MIDYDQLNVRTPYQLNDKLNKFVRETKLTHSQKIKKEAIINELIEMFLDVADPKLTKVPADISKIYKFIKT